MTQRREYNPESGENRFQWIVEECERQRHWQGRRDAPVAKPVPTPLRSLRGFNGNNHRDAALLPKGQESGLNTPSKYVFEISKARKL